jgi:MFS transporter, DHA2 family, methylenomycin A resistance protein
MQWMRERASASRRIVLVAMCAGYFLVLLDVTIVNVALPAIGSGLGASVADLQCVVDGYAIALASLMLAATSASCSRGWPCSGSPRSAALWRPEPRC